eukprot:TRINITY_DN16648_c0_g1_i2.p1 TRINITY_DN16648_c0_g1~~TRINITY_DN16648_c0_g1_i2.p1  ORF type:complete len:148 (-),score=30.38 TRINITY_DN16648_c0_g1_i2:627-1070(-)
MQVDRCKSNAAKGKSSLLVSGRLQTAPAQADKHTITVRGAEVPRYQWKTERNGSLEEVLAKMRKNKTDHSAHLKQSCLQVHGPANSGPFTSSTQDQQRGPASRAQDPKWSTELKKIERDMIDQIQDENAISVSLPMVPERKHMRKRH